jgi:hypothetical protein
MPNHSDARRHAPRSSSYGRLLQSAGALWSTREHRRARSHDWRCLSADAHPRLRYDSGKLRHFRVRSTGQELLQDEHVDERSDQRTCHRPVERERDGEKCFSRGNRPGHGLRFDQQQPESQAHGCRRPLCGKRSPAPFRFLDAGQSHCTFGLGPAPPRVGISDPPCLRHGPRERKLRHGWHSRRLLHPHAPAPGQRRAGHRRRGGGEDRRGADDFRLLRLHAGRR